ncbi:MAG: U32 family peptidase [Fibrobacter sp.]|nr:U32 family peptidase [Fibrobacter sp.]
MDASQKFELMLPVGNKDMFYAAVENGANAVYFGVPHWNARGRSLDFSFEDVREMIRYARIRHVRTFLAMNILVFEDEIDSLPEFIEDIAALEPDAMIIQDVGLMRLFKAVAPGVEIHASTQMTIASAEGVQMAERLGCTRAVLAREMSLEDIQNVANRTPLELEVFVHGALCVSFSGQCLTSENIGGRSANRGQCAQSCRLPYKMFVDGKPFDLHGKRYLFSPRDLSAIDDLDKLQEIGVKSFKIEGRLKSPEYVAATTIAFREKIDKGSVSEKNHEPLEVLFSRGLNAGWLRGVNQQTLVNGSFSNHHGMYLGKVIRVDRKSVLVEGRHPLEAGDGILFEDPGEENSAGSRLFSYKFNGDKTLLEFGNIFDFRRVHPGMSAFRNDSPAMEKRLHKTFAERENELKFPVKMRLFANFGEPLSLEIQDADGHKVVARSEKNLERAKTPRDNSERIQKELSALTGTAYFAREMRLDIPSDAFVIDKEVRNLRKAAVEALDNARFDSHPSEASAERGKALIANARSAYQDKNIQESDTAKPEQITVLVRSPKQLEKLQGLDIDRVILDLDWGVDYKKPMERVRELGFQVGVATIRVLKEGETKNLKKLADLKPDFILVRNPGALVYLQDSGIPLEGDYSLNVSNILSAEWFLSQGLRSLHPSLDLNALGTEKLLENFGGAHFEVSVFEHLPAFYMEHCLYAANLTDAERFPYCKQICSKHHIDILDHKGALHSLVPDAECRNTLYLERPQSALNLVPTFKKLGVHKFRLEMLEESAAEVADKTRLYAQAIRGKLSLATAAKLIGAEEKYGVSQGQLFHTEVWKDRKKA